VLLRDVQTAQRAYESVSQRATTLSLEGQNTQANVRLLTPAVEPYHAARPRVMVNIMASIAGGLLLGCVLAVGLELLNRRVRSPEDMMELAGVPVIGVLRPVNSKQPVFRRLTSAYGRPPTGRPLLKAPGAR
jgi:capsular polysaccharide biosynthesis protein